MSNEVMTELEPAIFSIDDIEAGLCGDYSLLERLPAIKKLPFDWVPVKLASIEPDARGILDTDNWGYGAYFVDTTGFGHRYESALTITEFVERLQPGYGYAIIETGKYQHVVGVFQRMQ